MKLDHAVAVQIQKAREAVVRALQMAGLSSDQKAMLAGMSVALCWVDGSGGAALQMLVDNYEVTPGRTFEDARREAARHGFPLDTIFPPE